MLKVLLIVTAVVWKTSRLVIFKQDIARLNHYHGIIHGRFPPWNFFVPSFRHAPPPLNCGIAFLWEMTYPLQGSNSFGSGNIFLIKIKIKTLVFEQAF